MPVVRESIENIYFAVVNIKIPRNSYFSSFSMCQYRACAPAISRESVFTPQSSVYVLLPGYSPLACRTALLIFLSHLFSSLSLLGHYLPRVLLAPWKSYYLACVCTYVWL